MMQSLVVKFIKAICATEFVVTAVQCCVSLLHPSLRSQSRDFYSSGLQQQSFVVGHLLLQSVGWAAYLGFDATQLIMAITAADHQYLSMKRS